MTEVIHYAIVRNLFGDLWIGTTSLPLKDNAIFDNYEDVMLEAEELLIQEGGSDDSLVNFRANNVEGFIEPAVAEFIIKGRH